MNAPETAGEDVDAFRARARAWLAERLEPLSPEGNWGEGSDDVSVFHALSVNEEQELLERAMKWQQAKCDAGFGAITWAPDLGPGLTAEHERAFAQEEATFAAPARHETSSVTTHLIAPTIEAFGTPEQRERFVRRFLRTDELCCQLFSEPRAGSDLGSLGTRADRDGDQWVINGQKVWSSGAQFSAWGELIARNDPTVPKHAGMTAFVIPLDLPGIEVRPIRQMSGGASFCEVFFTDVRVNDDLRLGAVGEGWKVALTTLGFERAGSGTDTVGGSFDRVLGLARWLGVTHDPVVRQDLARLYSERFITRMVRSDAGRPSSGGDAPGPKGSVGKLRWSQDLARTAEVVGRLLGPRLLADTGEWGTYAWSDHVLGAPGYRIAGGSDEIQRNIIAERVLGLPPDLRVDRDRPWRDVPR